MSRASTGDALRARLDGLTDECRDLLGVAACAGVQFAPGLVAAALEQRPLQVLRTLTMLERQQRLVHPAGDAYRFDHPQLRDLVYDELPPILREAYHGALADVYAKRLEESGEGAEAAHSEAGVRLCQHLTAAGRGVEGVPLFLGALQFLGASLRWTEALELLGSVLDAPGVLQGQERIAYQFERVGVLNHLGRRGEAIDALREIIDTAGDNPAVCARAKASLAWGHYLVRDLTHARELADEARLLAIHSSQAEPLQQAEWTLGQVAMNEGHFDDAGRHLQIAVGICRDLGDPSSLASALLALGDLCAVRGQSERATTCYEEALEIVTEHDLVFAHICLGALGRLDYFAGRVERAVERTTAALENARRVGHRDGEIGALGSIAVFQIHLGRYVEGERYARQALRVGRELMNTEAQAHGAENGGLLALRRGDRLHARELLQKAQRLAQALPRRLGMITEYLAQLSEAEGDIDAGLALHEEAARMLRDGGFRVDLTRVLAPWAGCLLEAGRLGACDKVREELARLGDELDIPSARVLAASLAAGAGEEAHARAVALYETHHEAMAVDDRITVAYHLWKAAPGERWLSEAHGILTQIASDLPDASRAAFLDASERNRRIVAAASLED